MAKQTTSKTSNKTAKTKRLVILDMHAILHRAYHALPDFSSSKGEPTGALFGLVSMLVRIITDLGPDYIVAAYDLPGPTYRHIAYEKYKAQRSKTDDALVAQIIKSREVLDAFGIPHYECEGFEADDIIGTIVEKMRHNIEVDTVVASGDMDMLQLLDNNHVRVFRMRKGITDMVLYDEASLLMSLVLHRTCCPITKDCAAIPPTISLALQALAKKQQARLLPPLAQSRSCIKHSKKIPKSLKKLALKRG